mmetsp:Transcript_23061/g.55601  ORF Transcript_23061/g.55601 Transcript_23061/m.55601 type:complete len:312 (-) Transcript_23061:1409-2344(-)
MLLVLSSSPSSAHLALLQRSLEPHGPRCRGGGRWERQSRPHGGRTSTCTPLPRVSHHARHLLDQHHPPLAALRFLQQEFLPAILIVALLLLAGGGGGGSAGGATAFVPIVSHQGRLLSGLSRLERRGGGGASAAAGGGVGPRGALGGILVFVRGGGGSGCSWVLRGHPIGEVPIEHLNGRRRTRRRLRRPGPRRHGAPPLPLLAAAREERRARRRLSRVVVVGVRILRVRAVGRGARREGRAVALVPDGGAAALVALLAHGRASAPAVRVGGTVVVVVADAAAEMFVAAANRRGPRAAAGGGLLLQLGIAH